MSKTTKYPDYSTGTIKVNGKNVSTTKNSDNGVTTSYNMSKTEKNIYNTVQNSLSSSLSNLFTFSDNQLDLWNQELDAYKQEGIKNINEIYEPMEAELKNDIASRFGNLDNSIFLDNLDTITDKKSDAVAELSNSLLEKQDELYSTEMQNRINYITLLSNLNTLINNNILNYASTSLKNSESGNNYNSNAYKVNSSNSSQNYSQIANTLLTFLGG